jgi:hypothetical protein
LQLKRDEPLSRFAFNFNLHRYKKVLLAACLSAAGGRNKEQVSDVSECVSEWVSVWQVKQVWIVDVRQS